MTTRSRRDLLKWATAGTVAVGTGALAVQVVTTTRSQAAPQAPAAAPAGERFAETYKGRRISGTAAAAAGTRALAEPGAVQVVVDGTPLHVMVNADGTYTSVTNHYQTFRSLRAVARAAVDELDGARLTHLHHG